MSRLLSDTLEWLNDVGDALGDAKKEIGSAAQEFASEVGSIATDAAGGARDYVVENPIKTAAVVVTTVATGGVAYAAAPFLAGLAGGAGLLGAASTGTAISTLSGAALTNASLAALGGGALAAGGGGMAAGTTVVAVAGATAGLGTSAGFVAVTSTFEPKA